MKTSTLTAVALLFSSGCHGNAAHQLSTLYAGGSAGSQVYLSTSTVLTVGAMMGDGYRYYSVDPSGAKTPLGYAPDPDPTRRINVQDCTLPVDPRAGNLMCK